MEMIAFYQFMIQVLIVGGILGAAYFLGRRNSNKS